MKFTFICEDEKRENKTITVSFDAVVGEKGILNNFLDFMKAVGYNCDKNEVLKNINEKLSSVNSTTEELDIYNHRIIDKLSLKTKGLDEGFPGISSEDFLGVKIDSAHGHGMRGPFIGPADC